MKKLEKYYINDIGDIKNNIEQIRKVENFTNKSLTEVIKWSQANKIDIEQIYEFSDLVDEYKIISQSKSENTSLKNLNKLTVVVSEGPNPDKEIIIPNMVTWNVDKVVNYINKNHLNNVKVSYKESDKIRNTLIEQDKSGTVKRSDEINLVFSLGEEEINEIKLENLENKSLLETEIYLKQNLIDFDIDYDFSNKIKRGYVIKTDRKIGTTLNKNDKIKIIVSKGKKIKVPNLNKYSMTEITNWIIKNKLKLEFTDKYDDQIKENKVISVNYNENDIIEEKTLIKVVLSKGKLVMGSFESLDDFKTWANKYGINYEEKYVFNNEVESGKVISYSHKKGDTIKNDDTIIITISQGEKTKIPDVIGKTKEDAIKVLEKAKLKYNFVYESSSKAKNTVLKQSLSPNSEVGADTTITLTLSNGKEPTNDNNSNKQSSKQQQNNSNNNSNNNNNSSNNNQNTNTPTPSCDTNDKTRIYIYDELLADSASATCENIKKAYPKHKFSCSYQTGTGMSSGLLMNSSEIDGKDFNHCDTINLKIIQN